MPSVELTEVLPGFDEISVNGVDNLLVAEFEKRGYILVRHLFVRR
jgi:hypothetical protein